MFVGIVGWSAIFWKKMTGNDLDLLRQFVHASSQDAFAELVRRHVNLVYSAAVRQVRSPQLAEEIAQSVFADLARQATRLRPDTILTAWLYAVARRTAVDVIRRESRRQMREQIAVELNAMNATDSSWEYIEPLLDEAVSALDETDRAAVLLRYFENRTLREVGERLGVSDDAAQKRVSRAVEKLRDFFAKRKVAVGGGGLTALLSANAVQSAPAGLAAVISAMVGGALAAVAPGAVALTQTIAMTTLQKITVSVALTLTLGAGLYEANQAAAARTELRQYQGGPSPLAGPGEWLPADYAGVTSRLAQARAEIERLKASPQGMELLKIRGDVGQLRSQLQAAAQAAATSSNSPTLIRHPMWVLDKYPDSKFGFSLKGATNVGQATPTAAIQTWLWALRQGSDEDLQRLGDFPPGTADGAKLKVVQSELKDVDRPDLLRLIAMCPLGDDRYYVWVADPFPYYPGDRIIRKTLHLVAGEWKLCVDPAMAPDMAE
jgi:RNA polymerase sigma factor (sigma-70 family)